MNIAPMAIKINIWWNSFTIPKSPSPSFSNSLNLCRGKSNRWATPSNGGPSGSLIGVNRPGVKCCSRLSPCNKIHNLFYTTRLVDFGYKKAAAEIQMDGWNFARRKRKRLNYLKPTILPPCRIIYPWCIVDDSWWLQKFSHNAEYNNYVNFLRQPPDTTV